MFTLSASYRLNIPSQFQCSGIFSIALESFSSTLPKKEKGYRCRNGERERERWSPGVRGSGRHPYGHAFEISLTQGPRPADCFGEWVRLLGALRRSWPLNHVKEGNEWRTKTKRNDRTDEKKTKKNARTASF